MKTWTLIPLLFLGPFLAPVPLQELHKTLACSTESCVHTGWRFLSSQVGLFFLSLLRPEPVPWLAFGMSSDQDCISCFILLSCLLEKLYSSSFHSVILVITSLPSSSSVMSLSIYCVLGRWFELVHSLLLLWSRIFPLALSCLLCVAGGFLKTGIIDP
jgi:hypothetical protein